MKKKLTKSEQKALDKFQKEFEMWQQKLQLGGYNIYFIAARLDNSWADITIDEEVKTVTVRLSRAQLLNLDSMTAKHECCHLFLHQLVSIARTRFTDGLRVQEEWERLTMILEKVL